MRQVNRDRGRKAEVTRIRTAIIATLLIAFVGVPPVEMLAQGHGRGHDKHDKQEQKWERRQQQRARQAAREQYWDAARYYRQDNNRYRSYRMTRNDRIYRGSDNRYYCKRDDGTTGLIIGGVSGAVLGNIIAPGGWKTLGTIIGGGAGAVLGREVDRGDVVCR
jgi:hypothetical protein